MAQTTKGTFSLESFQKANNAMAKLNEQNYIDVYEDYGNRSSRLKNYTPEEIKRVVDSGSTAEQQKLSRNYFYKNGFYKRIITHYATLLKYVGVLIPNTAYSKKLSAKYIEKRYHNAVDYLEEMDLPNLLKNFTLRALVDGSYYGMIQKIDNKNFTVLDLPSGYCRSQYNDLQGKDIIEFNVAYFSTITNVQLKRSLLKLYPRNIRTAYNMYNNGHYNKQWAVIPSDVSVYFTMTGGKPYFLSTIPATVEYDIAVETEREKDAEEIKKIIVQQIPHLADGVLLFEPEEAEEMHEGAVKMMSGNKNISILTTYADVESIVSKTSADTVSNNLQKMLDNIYFDSGTSSQLFASSGNLSLKTSLQNDLALMMILGDKYSKFITDVINSQHANSNINFKYAILPITYYNDTDYLTNTYKLTNTGYSFLLPALASGLSQRDLGNIKDLENNVLKLREKLIPLSSSATGGGDINEPVQEVNVGGAPAMKDNEKSDKTLENEKSIDGTK